MSADYVSCGKQIYKMHDSQSTVLNTCNAYVHVSLYTGFDRVCPCNLQFKGIVP